MADQATSSANSETPPEGAPAGGDAAATTGTATPTAADATAAGTDVLPAGAEAPAEPGAPGFGERGRMRRRLRFLRKARELAYRDLGGLVFEMQRLGERRDELVAAKLATLGAIDAEVRALEQALGDSHSVTVLREAGIAACPRCAAIHGSEDHFCPSCGLAMGRHADRPIAVAPASPPAVAGAAAATGPAVAPRASSVPAGAPPSSAVPTSAPPSSAVPTGAPPSRQPSARPPASSTSPDSSTPPAVGRPAPTPPREPAPATPTPRAPAPSGSPPRAPTPPPAADDRPTEIIRPSDLGQSDPSGGAGT